MLPSSCNRWPKAVKRSPTVQPSSTSKRAGTSRSHCRARIIAYFDVPKVEHTLLKIIKDSYSVDDRLAGGEQIVHVCGKS
eukprot:466902-Alexandrium_andersonii.AAC.1